MHLKVQQQPYIRVFENFYKWRVFGIYPRRFYSEASTHFFKSPPGDCKVQVQDEPWPHSHKVYVPASLESLGCIMHNVTNWINTWRNYWRCFLLLEKHSLSHQEVVGFL